MIDKIFKNGDVSEYYYVFRIMSENLLCVLFDSHLEHKIVVHKIPKEYIEDMQEVTTDELKRHIIRLTLRDDLVDSTRGGWKEFIGEVL
jgi:hypothetical protein